MGEDRHAADSGPAKINDPLWILKLDKYQPDKASRRRALKKTPPSPTALALPNPPCAYSSWRMISSILGLCLASRPVRGSVESTRAGLGWPTRSRALALTALVAENLAGLRFAMARVSME